jgi:hypothetical protein
MHKRTIEGLWTIEFGSSVGVFGGGVVVFQSGTVMGGDAGYYYVGTYQENGDSVRATVELAPFIEGYVSVFKTIGRALTLDLEATVTDDRHAVAQGRVRGMPNLKLGLKLTKRT